MKTLIYLIITVAAGLYYFEFIGPGFNFDVPEKVASSRTVSAIETYEFTQLLEQNTPTASLARKGYYTIIEGYIDTCPICKRLEADFTPFLRQRPDVLIRRVHFPENGAGQSFNGSSQAEVSRQMSAYFERLGEYRFNHVVKTGDSYQISTCGTPHIEIYGPAKQLIAADLCADKNDKTGLAFLKNWLKAEQS